MPSFKSRLLLFALRSRRLFTPKKQRVDWIDHDTDIMALRDMVESGAGFFGKLPAGFTLEADKIGDLAVEWMLPPDAARDRVILYLHGGGLVVGSIRAHRGVVSKFVQGSGIPALVIEYSLAPEKPYPAALNDTLVAYQYLLDQGIAPERIVFMGDSGGGNLCLASLLSIKDKGRPLPAGAVAMSPWLDLTNRVDSRRSNRKKDLLSWHNAEVVFSEYYAGKYDPADPLVSPIYGDLSGLPPIRLYVGGDEIMLSDSLEFTAKARAAGSDVEVTVGEGLFHCYPALAPLFPEATRAHKEICRFIREKIGGVE